jgi:hypothetical protein
VHHFNNQAFTGNVGAFLLVRLCFCEPISVAKTISLTYPALAGLGSVQFWCTVFPIFKEFYVGFSKVRYAQEDRTLFLDFKSVAPPTARGI